MLPSICPEITSVLAGALDMEYNPYGATCYGLDQAAMRSWIKGFSDRVAPVYEIFPRLGERRRQEAGRLSGGEQQMLVIGRALLSEPKIVLIDELSLGLAPKMVLTLLDTIQRFNAERGTACLLVEQAATAALKIATSAYLLQRGNVVYHGSAAGLRDDVDVLHSAYLGQGTARRESALRR